MSWIKKIIVLLLIIFPMLSSSCTYKGKEISREEMENFVKVNFMDASLQEIKEDLTDKEFHKVIVRESFDSSTNEWISYKEDFIWTKDIVYSSGIDTKGRKNEYYYYTLDGKYYHFDKTNNQKEELSPVIYNSIIYRLHQPTSYLSFMYGDMMNLDENSKYYSKEEGHIFAEGTNKDGNAKYIIEIENKHYIKQYSIIEESIRKEHVTFEYDNVKVELPE